MKPGLTAALALAAAIIPCGAPRAESISQILEGIGQTANSLNSDILDRIGGAQPAQGYQAEIARYKRLEAARVREMSAVTGVSPQVIRELRQQGQTWEQIAGKYGVNLDNLPSPEAGAQGN